MPLARQELAATKLREHPTLPSDHAMETVDAGELGLPCFALSEDVTGKMLMEMRML